MDTHEEGHDGGRVAVGLVIVLIGLVMLADRTGFTDIHLASHFWPFILILLGAVRMFEAPRRSGRRSRRSGGWLLWVGVWGLVSEFRLLGLDYSTSWPLLVIGVGLGMVWRAYGDTPVDGAGSVNGS